jgi:hypothetical protein
MGRNIEGVDEDIATAFGVFALTDAELHEAARQAGVTRWELEDAIEEAGLAEAFDIDGDSDVTETIDSLLDGDG